MDIGSEADGEWSDGTDSDTGVHSDEDQSNASANWSPLAKPNRGRTKSILVSKNNKTTNKMTTVHFPSKYDYVDSIMDRIDAEIDNLGVPQVPPSELNFKYLTSSQKTLLKAEGVEFETEDEFDLKDATMTINSDNTDTGLGSGSMLDQVSNIENANQDTNWDTTLTTQPEDSSLSTVKEKHTDMTTQDDSDSFESDDNADLKRAVLGNSTYPLQSHHLYNSDIESVQTEDFEDIFLESVANTVTGNRRKRANTLPLSLSLHSNPTHGFTLPMLVSSSTRSDTSDVDSVKTEDYENQFRSMVIKRVAGVPVTSFDQAMVDSDLDTVKSQLVKDKFQDVLRKPCSSDAISEDTDLESDFETVQKQTGYKRFVEKAADLTQVKIENFASPSSYTFKPRIVARPGSHIATTKPKYNKEKENKDECTSDWEIEQESQRIKKEIQLERKAKTMSTPNVAFSSKFSLMSLSTPDVSLIGSSTSKSETSMYEQRKSRLRQINNEIMEAKKQKKIALEDLKSLQGSLNGTKADVRLVEDQVKHDRSQAEDVRSRLMLIEFKRDSAKQELDSFTEEIKEKKEELREIEATQNQGSILTDIERDELERQLHATKEDLFAEQKRSRTKQEELEEDLEDLQHQVDLSQAEKEQLEGQVATLQQTVRQIEYNSNTINHEKNKENHNLREKLQNELLDQRKQHSMEMANLKQQLRGTQEKIVELQGENIHKDDLNLKLRNQLIDVQDGLSQAYETRDTLIEKHKGELQTLQKEKECALVQAKEEALYNKQVALDELRHCLELDKSQILEDLRRQLESDKADEERQLKAEHRQQLSRKDEEIRDLRKKFLESQEAMKQLGDRHRQESYEQVQVAIAREKEIWEKDHEQSFKIELAKYQQHSEKTISKLQDEVDTEKEKNLYLQKQIHQLRQELEEQKLQTHKAFKDKVSTVNKMREQAREEKKNDLHKYKTEVDQEIGKEMEHLKETVRKREEEILTLKTEKHSTTQKERESTAVIEKSEKMVLHEINEECRKCASVLGVTPRKVSLNRTDNLSPYRSPHRSMHDLRSPARNPTALAMANLRACNEELRNYLVELKQEVEKQRYNIVNIQQNQAEEIEQIKQKINLEKDQELQQIKDKLIQEHLDVLNKRSLSVDQSYEMQQKDKELTEIQRNMNKWKEDTAVKLAKKFRDEMNRELDKRLKDSKKNQFKFERERDTFQRERLRLSEPVMSLSATDGNYTGSLERRVENAERKARLADERAIKNQEMLTQKVSELDNMQVSLAHQSKELMKMQRSLSKSTPSLNNLSLSKLQSPVKSRSRYYNFT